MDIYLFINKFFLIGLCGFFSLLFSSNFCSVGDAKSCDKSSCKYCQTRLALFEGPVQTFFDAN